MTKRNRSYQAACNRAAELSRQLVDGKRRSAYRVAAMLTAEGFKTRKGGVYWYDTTAATAAKLGGYRAEPAAAPKSTPMPAKVAENAPETPAKPAQTPAAAEGSVSILPGTRRPLKRMLSRSDWESMPDAVRKAVVAELADRLLAGGDR